MEKSEPQFDIKEEYKFWDTQPVPKVTDSIRKDGLIESDINIDTIRKDPLMLPEGFEWVTIDLSNQEELNQIAEFLEKYYISDKNNRFKLHYSADFLRWALLPSEHPTNLCIGIKVKENGLLVSFIGGVQTKMQVNRNHIDTVEINFLCIHPKLRNKRLTPVIIKEMTRRCQLRGYNQAFYTSATYLPKPFYTLQYFHRAINSKILINSGFSKLKGNVSLKMMKKTYQLPKSPTNKNFVKLEEHHLDDTYDILTRYLDRYNLHQIFSFDEFVHIFYNNNFITCYVLEDDNKNVIDMISYYKLPYRCIKKDSKYQFVNAAYLFYYTSLYETPYRLIKDIIIVARDEDMAVFNATNIMENKDVMRELNFVEGTGKLHHYFYNWKCRDMSDNQIAKVNF